MSRAMEAVQRYYEAFGAKDFSKLRGVLAADFTFRGPLMSFENPDDFVRGVSAMPFEAVVEDSRFIADGNRVAHTFVWKMTAPAGAVIPMCEVFEVAGGRVRESRLYYDAKLFPAPA